MKAPPETTYRPTNRTAKWHPFTPEFEVAFMRETRLGGRRRYAAMWNIYYFSYGHGMSASLLSREGALPTWNDLTECDAVTPI